MAGGWALTGRSQAAVVVVANRGPATVAFRLADEAVAGNREPAVGGDTGRHVAAIEDEIYGVTSAVH